MTVTEDCGVGARGCIRALRSTLVSFAILHYTFTKSCLIVLYFSFNLVSRYCALTCIQILFRAICGGCGMNRSVQSRNSRWNTKSEIHVVQWRFQPGIECQSQDSCWKETWQSLQERAGQSVITACNLTRICACFHDLSNFQPVTSLSMFMTWHWHRLFVVVFDKGC